LLSKKIHFLDQKNEAWKILSKTLNTNAKIYGYRVDFVHN